MDALSSRKHSRYTRLDLVCDVFSLVCVLVMFLLVALAWKQLPAEIPTLYGFDGQPAGWGSRSTILMLPCMGLFLVVLLTVCRLLPARLYNYPVPVTADNEAALYALARDMLSVLKAASVLAFLPVVIFQLRGLPLYSWYQLIFLLLFTVPVVFYIIRMVRCK